MYKEAPVFFAKKSYELCYAFFRISSQIKKQSFSDSVERCGLALMEAACGRDYLRAEAESNNADLLIRLGFDLGLVSQENSAIIIKELQGFNSAIAELRNNAAITQDVDLGDIFSANEGEKNNSFVVDSGNIGRVGNDNDDEINESGKGVDVNHVQEDYGKNGNGNTNRNENGFMRVGESFGNGVAKQLVRKTLVFERIRQNGNCRLKEIQEVLPEVSERTIRYDVQNLMEQGLVERIGNGGPATYYRAIADTLPQ